MAAAAEIHRNYVGMLERSECAATLDVAERIAQGLGVPLESLITETRRTLERGGLIVSRRHPRR